MSKYTFGGCGENRYDNEYNTNKQSQDCCCDKHGFFEKNRTNCYEESDYEQSYERKECNCYENSDKKRKSEWVCRCCCKNSDNSYDEEKTECKEQPYEYCNERKSCGCFFPFFFCGRRR